MRLGPVVACLVLCVSCGCAWFRQLARPDPEPAPASAPWAVTCIWVERAAGAPTQPLGPLGSGRVWALDPNGRRFAIDGGLEDGFLRVDDFFAWTAERGREPLGVDASPLAAEFACRDTLRATFLERHLTVDRVAAMREGEDVDVAMAFPGSSDGGPRGTARRLVIFGDSLSDPGNLKNRLKIFPNTPYYLGRFSNGPNWAQYFAERTSMPVYNQAVGGAVSVPHPDIPAESILSAVQQGAQYLLTGSLNGYVGDYLQDDLVAGQIQRTNDTVFVIWSGGNDYLSKEPLTGEINTLLDSPSDPAGYVRVVEETTTAIMDQVRRLHAAGGRRFVVINLPDLGRIPGVLHNESYDAPGARSNAARLAQLSRRMSALTAYHNHELQRKVKALRKELAGTAFVLTDAERAVKSITAGRGPGGTRFSYGFDLTALLDTELRDRRGVIPIQDRCYVGGYLGTSDPDDVCDEEDDAFFWDNVHPTSFTHCWIAFFVERDLARAGLIAHEPDPTASRTYCEERQTPSATRGPAADRAQIAAP